MFSKWMFVFWLISYLRCCSTRFSRYRLRDRVSIRHLCISFIWRFSVSNCLVYPVCSYTINTESYTPETLIFSSLFFKTFDIQGGGGWSIGYGQYIVPSRFKVGFPNEVPLRGIAWICAIIANTEAIIYWQKCRELRAMEMGFQLKINNFELTHLSEL